MPAILSRTDGEGSEEEKTLPREKTSPSRAHADRNTKVFNLPMPSQFGQSRGGRRRFRARKIDAVVARILVDLRQRVVDPKLLGDSELLITCGAAADLWDRHRALFVGESSINHEDRREPILHVIWEAAEPLLERLVNLRPTSSFGHKARGAVFLAWDAGELLSRARSGSVFDRLALAVMLDLLSEDKRVLKSASTAPSASI